LIPVAEEEVIRKVVQEVLEKMPQISRGPKGETAGRTVPVNFSNRHVHVSRSHMDILFGPDSQLTKMRDLIQPGQFAAEECVTLVGPGGTKEGVRVLGPVRSYTQVEISITDGFALGLKSIPIRDSGDHAGTPGISVVGPKGSVTLTQGVIVAQRHLHLSPGDGERLRFKNGDWARVRMEGPRALTFDRVFVRVNKDFVLEMHVDMDEANACCLAPGAIGTIEQA
jgi:putative phosphotransacetylase